MDINFSQAYALPAILSRSLSLKSLLGEVADGYPDFEQWFTNKVLPESRSGHRSVLLSTYKEKVVGLAILKKSFIEPKICTLIVDKNYRGNGLGSMLLDRSVSILNTPKPLITVPDFRMDSLAPLLESRGFVLNDMLNCYYRPRSVEFVFNSIIPQHDLTFWQ
ncbi:GNAT family N-acetyltransferase [Maridesulfovibrio sp.]|uniref:GNAT family N-acetyltransferase n=1 Tax=Maridesulfovibrio sp. TaxID=2795000 RepID=UPI0039F1325D